MHIMTDQEWALRIGLSEIPDSVCSAAYEATPAQSRAWIKSTIALAVSVFGKTPQKQCTRTVQPDSGLAWTRWQKAADWTLCILGAEFAAPVRLAAALICARLAGIETVIPVILDTSARQQECLVALELCGICPVYTLAESSPTPPDWQAIVMACRQRLGPSGRILDFCRQSSDHEDLRSVAIRHGFPLWEDTAPFLLIDRNFSGDRASIHRAHPDALTELPGFPGAVPTVLYSDHEQSAAPPALCFGPGLEGCWLCPGLTPDFFLDAAFAFERMD